MVAHIQPVELTLPAQRLGGAARSRRERQPELSTIRTPEISPFEFEGADMLMYCTGRLAYSLDESEESSFRRSGMVTMVFHKRRDRWYIRSQVIRLEGELPEQTARD
jgi:hypothetical protein